VVSIGFNASYINTWINGEEEKYYSNYEEVLIGYLETIINTNEAHYQHKRVASDKDTKSHNYSQRRKTPRRIPKMSY
jgi:hypothetical protein